MNKINIITPPDKIHNKNCKILLIGLRQDLLNEIQDNFLNSIEINLDLYLYSKEVYNYDDIDWLCTIFQLSDITVIDVDNSSSSVRMLASYFISESKTYWLTNDQNPVYNHISSNRIYNAQFLTDLGGKIGKETY